MPHVSWIGDLERTLATSLYPMRLPIAIAASVGLFALVIIARRRGWLAAARRHRVRAAVGVAALVSVAAPAGWYLGSPLFIRTSLVEPPPGGPAASPVVAVVSSAPRDVPPATTPQHTPAPVAIPTAAPARSGSFSGADDFHFGRGRATLIETKPGAWVVRFEDFSVRNGPDLFVYLSPDPAGYARGAVELGRLKATDGAFNTRVPAGTDVTRLHSVVIWCRQFAVQFAVATLS
jgi:hypothetical protein